MLIHPKTGSKTNNVILRYKHNEYFKGLNLKLMCLHLRLNFYRRCDLDLNWSI